MGRRVQRPARGRWSLLQVAADAGVTERAARTCVARGYLDAKDLGRSDVVLLRVAAALLDAPRALDGQPRASLSVRSATRDQRALAETTRLLAAATVSAEAMLMLSPDEVLVVDNALLAAGNILRFGPVPVLVLPVGAWIHAVRRDAEREPDQTDSAVPRAARRRRSTQERALPAPPAAPPAPAFPPEVIEPLAAPAGEPDNAELTGEASGAPGDAGSDASYTDETAAALFDLDALDRQVGEQDADARPVAGTAAGRARARTASRTNRGRTRTP